MKYLGGKLNKANRAVLKDKKENNKIIYLEIIRIIAAFFVVFIHTDNQGLHLYTRYPCESWRFWVYLFISLFCNVAVPLFFCISGVLLLNRQDESLKTLWKKRILRIAIDLVVFSIAYAFFASWINGTDYNFVDYLRQMFTSETYGHLWYLYAYIAFLISTPFLRVMVKNLSNKSFVYMIVICIVFSLFQIIETMFGDNYGLNDYLIPVWCTSGAMIYPCIGYYLHYRVDINRIRKYLPVLWLINILSLFILAIINMILQKYQEDYTLNSFDCFQIINCITIFLTVRYFFEKRNLNKILEKAIITLGSCPFGVYLLHVFALQNPASKVLRRTLLRHLSAIPMIGIWIYVLYAFIICMVATYIFKKIPLIKRLF